MSLRRSRRTFSGLALVAMLLLALLPTAGRLAGISGHASAHLVASAGLGDHATHWQGMHGHGMHGQAMHGHGMHPPVAQHAAAGHTPSAPSQHPSAPRHEDCDYCPLVAGLAFLALPTALPPASLDATQALPARAALLRSTLLVPGLGARGPPHRA